MAISFSQVMDAMQTHGAPPRMLELMQRYPHIVEPLLPQFERKLREKGMLPAEPSLPAHLAAVAPYLHELDQALREGGDAGARARLVDIVSRPEARAALQAAALA